MFDHRRQAELLEGEELVETPFKRLIEADQLMAFLSELTDEDSGEESRPKA